MRYDFDNGAADKLSEFSGKSRPPEFFASEIHPMESLRGYCRAYIFSATRPHAQL